MSESRAFTDPRRRPRQAPPAGTAARQALESDIDDQLRRLQAAVKTKSDFLKLVGHELRAPLAVVRGYLSLMAEGSMGDVPKPVDSAFALMDVKLAEMSRLASQMLEVARLEDGELLLERGPVDARAVAKEAVEASAWARTARHRVELRAPAGPVLVMGDRSRLVTIVANLLSNAAKYSPEGGTIECRVAGEDGVALVSVRDYGVGIAEADRAVLFARFGRVRDDRTKKVAGLGLGLYLAHELAVAHGGELSVASSPGAGSTFTLRLPALDLEAEEEAG